jgi:7-keto-8-aminopelargonate synthetase-like enzyme
VHLFRHNSVDQLAKLLASVRESNCHAGIFVVIEGLYSMDSDIPDLASIVRLAREFEAIVIVDVAHDFGSTGKGGLGALGELEPSGYPDIIMGSFSKTFASNGGFIAGPEAAIEYIRCFAATHVFSNAISPMQTKVAQRCLDIVFSAEGELRRQQLRRNVELLRSSAIQCGLSVEGIASPICPIFVGKEILARFTARFLQERNVLANLVEFPAVPRAKARFRFQMMSTHLETDICRATEALAESKLRAFAFIRASRGLLGSVEMPD